MLTNNYLKIGLVIGALGFGLFFTNRFSQSNTSGNTVNAPTPTTTPITLMPYASPTYSAKATTIEDCEKDGGDWGIWGLAGSEYCQYPATDAGKKCTDGSQCSLDKCISEDHSSAGTCQKYPHQFGCYSLVENGRATTALCID